MNKLIIDLLMTYSYVERSAEIHARALTRYNIWGKISNQKNANT